jgi:hypothetical protein
MAVETDEDRAIFFDADDFGVTATVTPNTGLPFTVEVTFDSPHMNRGIRQSNQHDGNAVQASGQATTVRGRTSALANVKSGRASIEIEGVLYQVRDAQPDGTGTTTLKIMRA